MFPCEQSVENWLTSLSWATLQSHQPEATQPQCEVRVIHTADVSRRRFVIIINNLTTVTLQLQSIIRGNSPSNQSTTTTITNIKNFKNIECSGRSRLQSPRLLSWWWTLHFYLILMVLWFILTILSQHHIIIRFYGNNCERLNWLPLVLLVNSSNIVCNCLR